MDASERRHLFRQLRREGWTVTIGGKGHFQIRNPAGRLVTTTGESPSDQRGGLRLKRDLRHAGFIWPLGDRARKKCPEGFPAGHTPDPPVATARHDGARSVTTDGAPGAARVAPGVPRPRAGTNHKPRTGDPSMGKPTTTKRR